jgi:cytosine/uracil/thiamine/allantoin permease
MTFSPSSYNLGASLVSIGLLWWHGMVAAVIGSAILTVLVVLNSRGAIKYFIGFPVYVRAAAGVRGASLYILVRAVVAIIYFATQTYYGGRITSVFMRGIFGNGYHNIPNHLPASAGITSRDLLSFFLFWIVSNSRLCLVDLADCRRSKCQSCLFIRLYCVIFSLSRQCTRPLLSLVFLDGSSVQMEAPLEVSSTQRSRLSYPGRILYGR